MPFRLRGSAAAAIVVAAGLSVLTCGRLDSMQTDEERSRETELWEPVPPVVSAPPDARPPSDAVVLFGGNSLDAWRAADGGPAQWVVEGGAMTVRPGAGDLWTKESFGDVQLHVEWRAPAKLEGEGQGRGNSGVFLMGRYEIQVLDSYENETYVNGQAGSIYKQHVPLVNASRPPGEWQSYDVVFLAPRFEPDGSVAKPARFTVFHNGVLIQNHVPVRGATVWIGEPSYEAHAPAEPLMLQDHSNPVSFRNIWIRRLDPRARLAAADESASQAT